MDEVKCEILTIKSAQAIALGYQDNNFSLTRYNKRKNEYRVWAQNK